MWIIDIHSCTDVRVTKVFRYIEQRDILVDENAGEGVSQVVEADVPHTVLFKHLREPERDISRCQEVAQLVRAYIIVVCAVVTALEHTAVEVLLRLLFDQHFIDRRGDRQASAAAGVLHFLNRFENFLAVNLDFYHFGVEQNLALLHVNARPSHAERLTPSQSHAPREDDCRVDGFRSCETEQCQQFFFREVLSEEFVFLGAFHAVKGIGREDFFLVSLLERAAHDRVIVNDRVGDHALVEDGLIEFVDLIRAQACDGDGFRSEVAFDPAVNHVVVTAVSVDLQARLNTAEPLDHVLEDRHIRIGIL